MTNAEIQAYINKSLETQGAARAAYFTAQMDYAVALGNGSANKAMRENVVALKTAYHEA